MITVLQPGEMTGQHSICISKPRLGLGHLVRVCAFLYVHFSKSQRQVVPGLPRFILDKLVHCFVEITNKNEARLLGCQHFRKADAALRCSGNAGFDPICHLVALRWRMCQSRTGVALCLDRAHLSCWCHSCSRYWFIWPHLFRTECWRHTDWGCFHVFPWIMRRTASYVLAYLGWVETPAGLFTTLQTE